MLHSLAVLVPVFAGVAGAAWPFAIVLWHASATHSPQRLKGIKRAQCLLRGETRSIRAGPQVILVDHDADPELVRVDERAAEAISASCTQGPLACIQVPSPFGARARPCHDCRYAEYLAPV